MTHEFCTRLATVLLVEGNFFSKYWTKHASDCVHPQLGSHWPSTQQIRKDCMHVPSRTYRPLSSCGCGATTSGRAPEDRQKLIVTQTARSAGRIWFFCARHNCCASSLSARPPRGIDLGQCRGSQDVVCSRLVRSPRHNSHGYAASLGFGFKSTGRGNDTNNESVPAARTLAPSSYRTHTTPHVPSTHIRQTLACVSDEVVTWSRGCPVVLLIYSLGVANSDWDA